MYSLDELEESRKIIFSMSKIIDSFVMLHYLSKEMQDELEPYALIQIYKNKIQLESTFNLSDIHIYIENEVLKELIVENESIAYIPVDKTFEEISENSLNLYESSKENKQLCIAGTINGKRIEISFKSLNGHLETEIIRILEIYTFLFVSKLENSFLQKNIVKQNEKLQDKNKELLEMQASLIQHEKLSSIGKLSAGVAHELNNPIGFVSGNFNALKQYCTLMKTFIESTLSAIGTLPVTPQLDEIKSFYDNNQLEFIMEDLDNLFSESEDGLNRVTNIVKSLKDFAKVDSNGISEDYSINQGIESTLIISKNEYKTVANINLNLDPNVPLLTANGGEINEVLLNLIINSVHAIESKEMGRLGNISITTYSDEDWVYCIQEDDGIGIPEEIINKIFDPFFSTKAIGKGTGLGLNLSYNIIINKHKGKLLVNSEKGKFAKFTIMLPIRSTYTN